MTKNLLLAALSLEHLVEQFAVSVEHQDAQALSKVVTEINSRINDAFLTDPLYRQIYSIAGSENMLNILDRYKNDLGQKLSEILVIIQKGHQDPIFGAKLKHLINFAAAEIAREGSMQFYLAKSLYKSFNEKFKNLHRSAGWVRDLSFISNQEHKQKPFGKRGEADTVFAPGHAVYMESSFWVSDARNDRLSYLSPGEKKIYKVRKIQDGPPGQLKRNKDKNKMEAGVYLYSIGMHGGLVAASPEEFKGLALHHSIFRAGQPVMCAGDLHVNKDSEIETMDHDSGHILPPAENLIIAALYLYATGIILPKCKIQFHGQDLPLVHHDSKIIEVTVRDLLIGFDRGTMTTERGTLRADIEKFIEYDKIENPVLYRSIRAKY